MDDFYAARSRIIPPLPWSTFSPPFSSNWMNASTDPVAHLELISDGRIKLPVTETGYRSHFTNRDNIEAHGGPVAFAIAWLDHEAQSEAWQRHVEQSKQLSLF